jgi:hypothetical protein
MNERPKGYNPSIEAIPKINPNTPTRINSFTTGFDDINEKGNVGVLLDVCLDKLCHLS